MRTNIKFTNFKLIMFFSSFVPLWISIIFLNLSNIYKGNSNYNILIIVIIIIMLALSLISIILLIWEFKKIKKYNSQKECTIKSVQREKSISTEYILSYILPLVAFDFTDIGNIIAFVISMFILGYLSIKNNNIYVNPILELKYSFFNCTIEIDGEIVEDVFIISNENLTGKIGHKKKYFCFEKRFLIITQ